MKWLEGCFPLISAFLVSNWGVSYSHTIYINPNVTENNPDCLTSSSSRTPCRNITWVFQQEHSDSTHYVLSGGHHYLTQSTPPFQDLTSLAITGDSSVVTCTDSETGLTFINVANLVLYDVTFSQCAALRNSTSKNFTDMSISQFQVGLYFYLCENINMSHVTVSHSPDATGVVMYDTNGTNTISSSSFSNNRVLEGNTYPGGGGFYVEFTYCKPGVLSCDTPTNERNKGASYTFTNCQFRDNRADNLDGKDRFTYFFPYKEDHQSFGRGGGLSLYIRGIASDINFTVESSTFNNNMAPWGGGLFIEVRDYLYGSKIKVADSEFNGNTCPFTTTNGTAGGGARLAHYLYGLVPDTATRNEFEFDNCTFEKNTALNGAGMSVSWSRQSALVDQVVRINIQRSSFRNNTAKLGSAMHIDQFWEISRGLIAEVWVESCLFDRNTNQYWKVIDSSKPVQLGFGTVYVTSSSVWFRKMVSFRNSLGSALAVSGGSVSFNGTSALFENNFAYQGGGIFLVGSSTIELGFGTEMLFRNNTAIYRGGAMNVVYISRENLETDTNCFVRHVDPSKVPAKWNVTMQFIDNWESQRLSRNAIYATSILPCSIIGGSGVVTDRNKILCWEGWGYYNGSTPVDCKSQIATDIGSMEYDGTYGANNSNAGNHIQAFPGWSFSLPVTITDDLNKAVGHYAVFTANVADNESTHQFLVYDKSAIVYGLENKTYLMTLTTLSTRVWHGEIHVDLQQCPPGFAVDNRSCTCAGNYGGDVFCNFKAKEARLSQDYWMNMFDGSYYIAQCPRGYCKSNQNRSVPLPHDHAELNSALCSPGRTGIMCGECVPPEFGPAINSMTYECINCTDVNLAANIAKYVASVYLPLAALFTVLILFDIRLTTGPANAFILYCQVVSSTFSLDADGGIPPDQITSHSRNFIYAYRFLYGIFNLEFIENFLPPICLSTRLNTLTVLCLDYCVAFSPLVMIALLLALFKLKDFCKFSRRGILQDSTRNGRSIGEAMLPAFASFILLSYTKFSTVSAYILATNILVDENGNPHSDGKGTFPGRWTHGVLNTTGTTSQLS